MLDHLHLGDGGHGAFEFLQRRAALGGKTDAQEHGHAKAKGGIVHDHAAPGEDAAVDQPLDAPPGGGLADTHGTADLGRAFGGVLGEDPKDRQVGRVQPAHNASSPLSLMVDTSINASLSDTCGRRRIRSR